MMGRGDSPSGPTAWNLPSSYADNARDEALVSHPSVWDGFSCDEAPLELSKLPQVAPNPYSCQSSQLIYWFTKLDFVEVTSVCHWFCT